MASGRKYLAFDLETVKEFPEGADWRKYRPLGISVAAAYASDTGQLTYWYGRTPAGRPTRQMNMGEVAAMVRALQAMVSDRGYTLVSWNGLGFDFPILAEESGSVSDCTQLALNHVDMMFHVFCLKGHYLELDAAAKGMGLPGKMVGVTGADAPRLWAQGDYERVLVYLGQDARVTADLAQASDNCRALCWTSQRGNPQKVGLSSGWLTVREALALPEPDTSWMTDPPKREEFIAWVRGPIRSHQAQRAPPDRTRTASSESRPDEGTNQYDRRDPHTQSGQSSRTGTGTAKCVTEAKRRGQIGVITALVGGMLILLAAAVDRATEDPPIAGLGDWDWVDYLVRVAETLYFFGSVALVWGIWRYVRRRKGLTYSHIAWLFATTAILSAIIFGLTVVAHWSYPLLPSTYIGEDCDQLYDGRCPTRCEEIYEFADVDLGNRWWVDYLQRNAEAAQGLSLLVFFLSVCFSVAGFVETRKGRGDVVYQAEDKERADG